VPRIVRPIGRVVANFDYRPRANVIHFEPVSKTSTGTAPKLLLVVLICTVGATLLINDSELRPVTG
jgi:hypothetical protein